MLDLDLKTEVNPLKTWPWPSSQSIAILPRKVEMRRVPVPKECRWYLKTAEAALFLIGFLPFSWCKWSLFEVLTKFKKIGYTICDPYQIFKKIFCLRHHGVKPFCTKVGILISMPLLIGLNSIFDVIWLIYFFFCIFSWLIGWSLIAPFYILATATCTTSLTKTLSSWEKLWKRYWYFNKKLSLKNELSLAANRFNF